MTGAKAEKYGIITNQAPMIYDCFPFFNELDLLEIRLNVLKDVVDRFVLVEAGETHTGHAKPFYFEKNRARFAAFADRIIYLKIESFPPGHDAWWNENYQRNELMKGLVGAADEDDILISDLDEIPNPQAIARFRGTPGIKTFRQRYYSFYLNYLNVRNDNLYTTKMLPYREAKTIYDGVKVYANEFLVEDINRGTTLTKIRRRWLPRSRGGELLVEDGGWHFTCLGGAEAMVRKMRAVAPHGDFNPEDTELTVEKVAAMIARGVGPALKMNCFAVELDETFPSYIVENQRRYGHLLFKVTPEYLRRTRLPRFLRTLQGKSIRCAEKLCPPALHNALHRAKMKMLDAKTRLGDFWWYSLMIFLACRAADLLNVFVGLWLVPKYVQPSELGAVMPLAQFANLLAVPAAVFASTFRQELSGLAVRCEFGRMKSLMRGVFIATAIMFFTAIIVSRFILPGFLGRLRIAEGSLGLVILSASFIGALSPIYTNALQTLKKFSAYSWINILSAPVRFLSMVAAMPLRALTGYFVGQAVTPAFTISASVVALRKELAVPSQPYWNKAILRRFVSLFTVFALGSVSAAAVSLIETTVLRHQLSAMDSAAYYLVTRFSEISTFISATLLFTIFPFSAELAAKGHDHRPLILKCAGATVIFGMVLALVASVFGREMLAILPNGAIYSDYWWAIPSMIGVTVLNQIASLYFTAEAAISRFTYLWWSLPLAIVYAVALIKTSSVQSLGALIGWMAAFNGIRVLVCLIAMAKSNKNSPLPPSPHR